MGNNQRPKASTTKQKTEGRRTIRAVRANFSFMLRLGYPFYIFVVVLSVASIFLPILGFVLFITTVAALLLSWKLHSLVESLALSILIWFVANNTLYSFVTLFGLHLSVFLAPVIVLITGVSALVYHARKKQSLDINFNLVASGDLPALMVGVATLVLLLVPVYKLSGANIAQFMSYGEDNASHYALSRYIYRSGDFTYGQSAQTVGLVKGLAEYPQGFHVNAAVFAGLTSPHKPSEEGFVKVYALFIALNYALFVFWLIKLCTLFSRDTPILVTLSSLGALFLLGGWGLSLLLLDRGFQTQIFAYTFLLASVALLNRPYAQGSSRQRIILLVGILCVGIAASWWLLLLIPAILLLQYALQERAWEDFWRLLTKNWLIAAVLLFDILYPILISILLSTKQNQLDEPGGVDKINGAIFYYLLPVVILSVPLLLKKVKEYRLILSCLVLAILSSFAIGLYQKITVGNFEYYFYKSIYTILIFSLVIFFIATYPLLSYLYSRTRSLRFLIPVGVVILTVLIANATNLVYLKVYIHNWFPNAVQPGDFDTLFSNNASQYKDVLYIGSCSSARNYLEDRWSGARFLSEGRFHSSIELDSLSQNYSRIGVLLTEISKTHNQVLLVQYNDCASKIPHLQTIESSPNISTIIAQ